MDPWGSRADDAIFCSRANAHRRMESSVRLANASANYLEAGRNAESTLLSQLAELENQARAIAVVYSLPSCKEYIVTAAASQAPQNTAVVLRFETTLKMR